MRKAGIKRGGGRSARIAARQSKVNEITTSIERRIPYFDVLNEEALGLIEHNAETVLEEIGIEFREFKPPNIFQLAIKNILFVINLNLIYRFVFYRSIKLKLNAK